jgi:hypothetical protein
MTPSWATSTRSRRNIRDADSVQPETARNADSGRRIRTTLARERAHTYDGYVLRLLRLALLVVLFFWILGLVIAIGRPETGLIEDGVLVGVVAGLFVLAIPVRRLGARSF